MNGNDLNFEKSLDELEKIVAKLENGECTLDESIKLFENGMKLSDDCRKTLETAHQKIVSLTDTEKEVEEND